MNIQKANMMRFHFPRCVKSPKIKGFVQSFARCEAGASSVEFVIIFPVFFMFFLMIVESGVISVRHVMLERAVDVAVRDIRIGAMSNPTHELLLDRICQVASIIPDCKNQVQIEMLRRSPRSWQTIDRTVACIDRGALSQPVVEFTTGGNNELVYVRACARIDPFFPTTGLGKAITRENSGSAAGGSYALVSDGAFVVEPFN
jgi:hypothetical protein